MTLAAKPKVGDLVKITLHPPLDLDGTDPKDHLYGTVESVNGDDVGVRVKAGYLWKVLSNEVNIISTVDGRSTTRFALSRERIQAAVAKAKSQRDSD